MRGTHNHPKPEPVPDFSNSPLAQTMETLMIAVPVTLALAVGGAAFLHYKNWRGTFALVPAAFAGVVSLFVPEALVVAIASVLAAGFRESWRLQEIKKGHEKLRRGKAAVGLLTYWRNWQDRRRLSRGEFFSGEAYAAGVDATGGVLRLPMGLTAGRHSLLMGATGSGKTTTLMTAAHAYLRAGTGLVVIDAKGNTEIAETLRPLALLAGRPFFHFNLDGESHKWNPLAYGTPSERADKLIAAEEWTEPHYKRLYQRYLLMVFLAIDARQEIADVGKVARLCHPDRLAVYAREIADPQAIEKIDGYLADLTDREKRDLAGLRNRIALLADSEHGHLLTPDYADPASHIDMVSAIHTGAVVVFSINSSRYPETAKLLGAAVFQDLQSVAGIMEALPELQHPTGVLVDEFGAFGADHIVGLFQRARSVRMSLMLATQELADLRRIDPTFQDQVLGNVEVVIAHRQNVPESAELVAEFAGTREVWIHTFQTDQTLGHAGDLLPAERGTKRRGHEFHVAPDTIKQLEVGHAVVVTKNPHQVREAEMFKASVQPRPTITPDGQKTEIALRVQAAMQSQAIAVKVALGGRRVVADR